MAAFGAHLFNTRAIGRVRSARLLARMGVLALDRLILWPAAPILGRMIACG